MVSIFTKIINKEIPCYKVAETENCIAFLDINPNAEGHTLCIPKKEIDNIFDLDTELYNELMVFSKKVAKALKKAISCERIAMSVIGLEVPHAHVHLIPINEMKDITFINKKTFSESEFRNIADKIKACF
ncbi:MAG: HIT family protein [Bacteroidetes bacterium]|nr:MAG: HIT family hydrolase [Cryomorphaceae bacterium BACL29 MAG-121220-bin8]MDA0757651.1 HIT family protein [Bacteroidota bacterium]MDA1018767.1 HIT family protein [Bacteroidota bacterium]